MEVLGQLVAGLEHFVRDHGVVSVMVILAFEALGAPLPGETLLIFASILALRGEMSLQALLIFAWAGSVIGDNVGYLIGRSLGRAAIARYGAKIGLTAPRFNAVEGMFARYGAATVAFARFVNVLRQLNGVVAGTLGMNWWRFLLFNALGGALWVATWVLGAYYLGEHASSFVWLARHVGVIGGMLAAAVVLIAIVVVLRRLHHGAHCPKDNTAGACGEAESAATKPDTRAACLGDRALG
jgi:membrane protein DedA with SNARE-associated domain